MSRYAPTIDENAEALAALADGPQNAKVVGGALTEEAFGFYGGEVSNRVSEHNARSIEIVYSAINLLVSSLSTLPVSLLDQSKGRRAIARTHWAHQVLHNEPRPGWTPSRHFGAFYLNAILFGNAIAVVFRQRRQIEVVPWHRVRVENRPEFAEPRYYVGDAGVWYTASDVIHLQAPSLMGKTGDSPVVKCARALGVSLSAEAFASNFYQKASGLSGYIKTHQDVEWPEDDRKKFIESFREQFSGPANAGKTGILPPGSDYMDRKPPQREAQHVESAMHQTRVVARIFNIPPHKLGDDSKTSYSSLEQEQTRYVVDALRPWMVRSDQEHTLKLLRPVSRRNGMKFITNADALLRGDARTRTEILVAETGGGLRTVNEARDKLDLDPVPGGDQVLIPANNMAPLEQVASQQDGGDQATNYAPLFVSACDRLLRIERNAISKEMAKGGQGEDFVAWADRFYDAHDARCREAHGYTCGWVADQIGVDVDRVMEEVASVTNRGGVVAAIRGGEVNDLISGWEGRAQSDAERINTKINQLLETRDD